MNVVNATYIWLLLGTTFASLTHNYIICNTMYIEPVITLRIKSITNSENNNPRSKDEYYAVGWTIVTFVQARELFNHHVTKYYSIIIWQNIIQSSYDKILFNNIFCKNIYYEILKLWNIETLNKLWNIETSYIQLNNY